MAPSLLWRRKSSTPRFPGAWPNTSVSSHASHVPVPQHDPPPQLPELLHIRPRSRGRDDHAQDDQYSLNERGLGWGFPTTSESHPVGGDIASGPQRWCRENPDPDENADKPLAFQTSPASGMAPLSTSFSQDSTFTEITDSEGVLTPDSFSRAPWAPLPTDHSQHSKSQSNIVAETQDNNFSNSISSRHDTIISPIPVHPSIPPSASDCANYATSRVSTTYSHSPMLDFVPPLTLSTLSLNLTGISYHTADDDSLPAPPSPHSPSESTPSSFAIPSPYTGGIALHASVEMASTFFPVPSILSAHGIRQTPMNHSATSHSVSSSLPSTYSFADSPVLPTDANTGLSPSPHPPLTAPLAIPGPYLSPTSTDLDAFARAAAAAASATSSSLSLPSIGPSNVGPDESCDEVPLRGRAYTAGSGAPSPALAVTECSSPEPTPSESDEPPAFSAQRRDRDPTCLPRIMATDSIQGTARARRRSEPAFSAPYDPVIPVISDRTISSRVDVGHDQALRTGGFDRERPVKLLVFGRMKRIGGKILSLLSGGKASGGKATGGRQKSVESDLGGVRRMTTTSVTKVEYKSEHPIPVPETPARNPRVSRRSLAMPIPVTISPTHPPRTPQRSSFLPIEDEHASRSLLSRPFRSRAGTQVHPSAEADVDAGMNIMPVIDTTPYHRVIRARTQTAPAVTMNAPSPFMREDAPDAIKRRRFSLSSALSKSRMETLKATVVPHPPVPNFPRSTLVDPIVRSTIDRPVRPVSMISGAGLDARQSEGNIRAAALKDGAKQGRRKSKRPVSMGTGGRFSRHAISESLTRRTVPTAMGSSGASCEGRTKGSSKPTTMLLGQDPSVRQNWIEAYGPRIKVYRAPESEKENDGVETDAPSMTPRTHALRTLEHGRSPPTSRKSERTSPNLSNAVKLPDNATESPESSKDGKTSRRFSLSSAISKRALRARSMIVSVSKRTSDMDSAIEPQIPITPPGRRARGGTFSTIVDAGVRFDMLTPGLENSPSQAVGQNGVPGLSMNPDDVMTESEDEYAPAESELDSMSFAHTATMQDSDFGSLFERYADVESSHAGSVLADSQNDHEVGLEENVPIANPITTSGLGEPFGGSLPVMKRLELSPALSSGQESSVGSDADDRAAEEEEEDRGFMRALGLDFNCDRERMAEVGC